VSVALVGAGPGSADLLTLRAARLLEEAEVVVHDRLVDPSVLALASPDAELIDVGKRPGGAHNQGLINELLVLLGRRHERVVRLKGGDPYVFGRGGEEVEALREAGIEIEIVPGISSALSAPGAAGIPVTHRGASHGVTVVTGHAREGEGVDFTRLANPSLTLVVLMGVGNRAAIAAELQAGGLAADTPVAVVESAWTQSQRCLRGRLDQLGELEVANPAVLIVGAVAALDLGTIESLARAAS
jgi:uroporphyrin-III C-methyltransferase